MFKIDYISKLYTEQKGIFDISFDIREQEVVALVGPNGAGKSTLLKIIVGILEKDQGELRINDTIASVTDLKKYVGYLPEYIDVDEQITAYDLLHLISDCKFQGKYKEQIETAIDQYHLRNVIKEKMGKLSQGMKKKVGLIIAFMGEPNLIVLDEPTNGLDTLGIIQLKENIERAKQQGISFLISSHILDFVNVICDRCVFLKDTKVSVIKDGQEDLEAVYKDLYMIN